MRYRRYRPSAGAARRTARELARQWGVGCLAEDLALVVSELVTNAIVHGRAPAGSRVVVTYRLRDDDVLHVDVRDFATGLPATGPRPACDEGGRGLPIVDALTDRWGVLPHVVGKSLWFEMSVPPAAPGAGHPG
ncbi:ATP-binding protein [Streptomyces sp. DSM 44917]|uniref:ATP-binding protein n=1 Tax=Streptomyces boetiae TaxID=3075541 RepID=A0ABU2L5S1_9ACTN|nr:ATP-binding protein [Streptomyces sp. DSM 44917]MDT0306910.1 ATP-binding protein [Streptomyces sp. DSM 44917]